jgi:hypothetical protein
MMKKTLLVSLFILLAVIITTGMVIAAPQQGLLVDKDGTPIKGFSNVYIENGRAYPVYNSTEQLWYNVFVVGSAPDGTVLCALGQPLGVDSAESVWDDNVNAHEEEHK